MFSTPIRRLLATPAAIALACLTAVQPVLSDNCVPQQGAFPPGSWHAGGIQIRHDMEDDISRTVVNAEAEFDLVVDQTGIATGDFQAVGEGYSYSIRSYDNSQSEALFIKTGKMHGTGMVIRVDGLMEVDIEGVIDSNPNGDGDEYSGSGQDLWPFKNHFEKDFSFEFSPSQANCNQVFGSLSGPAEYGTEYDGNESFFLAFRH